jgi:hypothetical protein
MTSQICVPLKALAVGGADDGTPGGAPVPPAVGDDVSDVTITGKVARVDGDNAYVDVETVNGEPVPESGEDKSGEPDQDDGMTDDEVNKLGKSEAYV